MATALNDQRTPLENYLADLQDGIQRGQQSIATVDAEIAKCADGQGAPGMDMAALQAQKEGFMAGLDRRKYMTVFFKNGIKLQEYRLAFEAGPWC